jgi:hypothetical protein
MLIKRLSICHAISAFFAVAALGQGTFENLNFEEATPGPSGSFSVSAASAIPDWTAEIGGVVQTEIGQNAFSTGAPEVSLLTPPYQLDGSYSVLLIGTGESASISQTGFIPVGTEFLFFDAEKGGPGNLVVTLGNQNLTFAPVATFPSYTVYGASVGAWVGTTEELTFTASTTTLGLNNWEIDDISFSPGAVPEPNPLVLTGVGALLIGLYRRLTGRV